MSLQRTANSVLTVCLSSGDNRTVGLSIQEIARQMRLGVGTVVRAIQVHERALHALQNP